MDFTDYFSAWTRLNNTRENFQLKNPGLSWSSLKLRVRESMAQF